MGKHLNTITFDISASEIVTCTTVKVSVNINSVVRENQTNSDIQTDIRNIIKEFIDTKWQFSQITRNTDPAGIEHVNLMATARVEEQENHALHDRARKVSRPGLALSQVVVDSSIPQNLIDAAEKNLRINLLKMISEETTSINKELGIGKYSINQVNFSRSATAFANNTRSVQPMMGATAMSYGSGFDTEDTALGNAHKISLHANVTLAKLLA